jgi:hypothetical protein
MTTPSHLLVAAGLAKGLRHRVPVAQAPFLIGAVAPDLALILLSAGLALYSWLLTDLDMQAVHLMYQNLYRTNPIWIASHNLLHAPLVLMAGLAGALPYRAKAGSIGRWSFWFFLGAALHSGIDILTHIDDGPLLLFPINWTLRFHSPVSWWDTPYFRYIELILDLVLLAYLLVPRLRRNAQS